MSNAITRRRLIGAGAAGLCSLALSRTLRAAEGKRQPNVLIITTDQQRVDAMSAVGNQWVKTPNMDSIAAHGVYFTKSYCPYPLCSPSRASPAHRPHAARDRRRPQQRADRPEQSRSPARSSARPATTPATPASGIARRSIRPTASPGFEVLNNTTRQGKLAQRRRRGDDERGHRVPPTQTRQAVPAGGVVHQPARYLPAGRRDQPDAGRSVEAVRAAGRGRVAAAAGQLRRHAGPAGQGSAAGPDTTTGTRITGEGIATPITA